MHIFYTLVLGGTALGAVSSQHILLRSCMLSLWTSVPLLAASWLLDGAGLGSRATAAMMLLFGVMLTVLAIRMNDFLAQNARLVDELAAKNAALVQTGAQLAEAHLEKSRFLAQASHDLRQPIHAIGLYVEYLNGIRMGRGGREVLASIDRSLESLARLCRSLLDLSALDIGRVKPDIAPVPLEEVLGEVVRQARETAREAGVALRLRPSRRWVRSDAALLHAMVQNLVANAIKHAPGSRVLVGVRRRKGRLSIIVADTRPGIEAADQRRVFEEFVQIGRPEAEDAEGLGLGLSIVKRLAAMLDLQVALRSQPGRGACFSIDSLVECPPGASRGHRQPVAFAGRLQGLRVLVVDDDRPVRAGTMQLLARWGCNVRATDRIEPQNVEPCDFLLCDHYRSGGESGLEVIRAVRDRAGRQIPAAIVTGGRTDQIAEACKTETIALLAKPVRPAQLRSALLAGIAGQARPSSAATAAAAEREETSSARKSAET